MPFPAPDRVGGLDARRERVARHVETVAEELARHVIGLDPLSAEHILTTLLTVAERIRHGDTMGEVQVDTHFEADKMLGGAHRIAIRIERGCNKFSERSRPLSLDEGAHLVRQVRLMERAEIAGAGVDEATALLSALPVDLEKWLGDVATAARATAPPNEVALWKDRAPVLVIAQELVESIRIVIRIAG